MICQRAVLRTGTNNMWLLTLLPDAFMVFIVNAILLVGIVGVIVSFFILEPVLKFIPPLRAYSKLFQIASVIILTLGVYLFGGMKTEQVWRERVKELEVKVAIAEEKSKKLNFVIETKVITKTKIVKERGRDIIEYVDREVIKYDSQCIIPKEFIKAFNDSVEKPKDSDEKPK